MSSLTHLWTEVRRSRFSALFVLCLATVVVGVVFGGASQKNALRLAVVELTGPSLLAACAIRHIRDRGFAVSKGHGFLVVLALLLCAMPLIQLLPLPPQFWTRLPGREQLVLALQVTGLEPGWASLSLTPDQTWQAFLALLPPLGVLWAVTVLQVDGARRLIWVLAVAAAVNIAWAAAQASSAASALYLWPTTDPGAITGLFANRNHLATFCLMMLPFAAARIGRSFRAGKSRREFYAWGPLALAMLVTVPIGGSRAGLVILLPVLVSSAAAAWIAADRPGFKPRTWLFLGLAASAVVAVGVIASLPTLSRFGEASVDVGRMGGWPIVAAAAGDFLPVGSGVGSFDAVYRSVEPMERLTPLFFNHAHNDYLELLLETGWLGMGLLAAFLIWFLRRASQAWLAGVSEARDLQRAASIGIGVVLLHSFVDYPLRTETLAILFALCCGILEMKSIRPASRRPHSGAVRRMSHQAPRV